jgi:hypothetical protein
MDLIQKEMDEMSESMEKSVKVEKETRDMLVKTVLELGPEGLKKAMPMLSEDHKTLLKGILEDMKRIKKEESLEPAVNSTPSGDMEWNTETRPAWDEHDEVLEKEAEKRRQMMHRNQGGVPVEGWEGQIIKAEAMSAKQKKHESAEDVEIAKIKDADKKLEEAQKDMEKADGMASYAVGDAGDGDTGDGDRIEKCDPMTCKDPAHKHGEAMKLEDKKKAAKENLKKMIGRMQERKMEKSTCISALANSLGASEDSLSKAWDFVAKSEKYKYDDGTVGEATPEADQSEVPEQMKKDIEGAVHDPDTVDTPAYQDPAAKKIKKEEKPLSGKEDEEADETIAKVPSTIDHHGDMKKSIYHTEQEVYTQRKNPLLKKGLSYSVDSFIAAEDALVKASLAKSTFFDAEAGEILTKAKGEGSKGGKVIGHTKSGKAIYEAEHASHRAFTKEDHQDAAKELKGLKDYYKHVGQEDKAHQVSQRAARHESLASNPAALHSFRTRDVEAKEEKAKLHLVKGKEVVAGNPGQEEMDETKAGPKEAEEQSKLPEWMDHKQDAKRLKEAAEAKLPVDEMMKTHYSEDMEKAYMGFKKLESKIAEHGGVKDPAAVAAAIGRKKYGAEKFNAAAHKHHKMSHAKPMKKSLSDLIEAGLDMDDLTVEVATKNTLVKSQNAFKVKSFSDAEMESLFSHDFEKSRKMAEEKEQAEARKAKKKEEARPKEDLKKDIY